MLPLSVGSGWRPSRTHADHTLSTRRIPEGVQITSEAMGSLSSFLSAYCRVWKASTEHVSHCYLEHCFDEMLAVFNVMFLKKLSRQAVDVLLALRGID